MVHRAVTGRNMLGAHETRTTKEDDSVGDIKNDKDVKPADHILDDWLTEHGMAVTFEDARRLLGDLREAFRRELD